MTHSLAALCLSILIGSVAVSETLAAGRCAGTTGIASFYGEAHHGRQTASGKPFNMHAMTAAMWDVPFGSRYRVTHGGKSVVVTINDRGPARRLGRIIDLSRAAFAKLADTDRGLIRVCIEKVN